MSDPHREPATGFFRRQVELKLRRGAISIHEDVQRAIRIELKVRRNVLELLDQFGLTVTDTGVARRTGVERPFETKVFREPLQNLVQVATFIVAIQLRNGL